MLPIDDDCIHNYNALHYMFFEPPTIYTINLKKNDTVIGR